MSTATGMDSFTASWKINDMEYGLHGVVHTVHWSCVAGILEDGSDYVTTNGVTQLQNTSYDASGFIEFADLSEETVLKWVKEQMQEKWDETEENILAAWEDTKWNKEGKKGLPWVGTPQSDEEEEPTWVQAALSTIEPTEPETGFEPLEMPEEDSEGAKENAAKSEKKAYVNEEGRTGITFGTNIDKEEE